MFRQRLKICYQKRDILHSMVIKAFRTRYVGSFLGVGWAVITPVMLMVVINFVFTIVFPVHIQRFPLFVLSGLLPWLFFSSTLNEAPQSLVNQVALIHQFTVPKIFIPLAEVFAHAITFCFGLIMMVPFFIIFGPRFSWSALIVLPLIVGLHIILTSGFAVMIASLNVVVRDLAHILGTVLMLWFWMTPVFYDISMIPDRYQSWLFLNPMTSFIQLYRTILYTGVLPTGQLLLISAGWAGTFLVLGMTLFFTLEDSLAKRI